MHCRRSEGFIEKFCWVTLQYDVQLVDAATNILNILGWGVE